MNHKGYCVPTKGAEQGANAASGFSETRADQSGIGIPPALQHLARTIPQRELRHRRLPFDRTGQVLRAERLRALQHVRQCLGVDGGAVQGALSVKNCPGPCKAHAGRETPERRILLVPQELLLQVSHCRADRVDAGYNHCPPGLPARFRRSRPPREIRGMTNVDQGRCAIFFPRDERRAFEVFKLDSLGASDFHSPRACSSCPVRTAGWLWVSSFR